MDAISIFTAAIVVMGFAAMAGIFLAIAEVTRLLVLLCYAMGKALKHLSKRSNLVVSETPTTMESDLDNKQLVFVGGNVRNVVGYSQDGSADWQEQVLDHTGRLIATVHGMTAREAAENAEYIVRAINRDKQDAT